VKRFETLKLDEKKIRAKAAEFDTGVFRDRITAVVETEWRKFQSKK
jgi:hypothetical protein